MFLYFFWCIFILQLSNPSVAKGMDKVIPIYSFMFGFRGYKYMKAEFKSNTGFRGYKYMKAEFKSNTRGNAMVWSQISSGT